MASSPAIKAHASRAKPGDVRNYCLRADPPFFCFRVECSDGDEMQEDHDPLALNDYTEESGGEDDRLVEDG